MLIQRDSQRDVNGAENDSYVNADHVMSNVTGYCTDNASTTQSRAESEASLSLIG